MIDIALYIDLIVAKKIVFVYLEHIFYLIQNQKMADLINKSNINNHAGVERREASERAEALLKLINEYRVYSHRFESLPTWDVLEFLSRLEKEVFNRFGGDVENGEIDKVRNEYFLVFGKKPFMAWGGGELRTRIEQHTPEEISGKTLHSKKSRWGK